MVRSPARRVAVMNASGDIDGRDECAWLLPRGPVTAHATFSSAKFVKCTPCQIDVQMCAYERGLTNFPPETCRNQFGLAGSFHAVQYFTAGRYVSVKLSVFGM